MNFGVMAKRDTKLRSCLSKHKHLSRDILAILGVKVLCKCVLVKFRYSVDQVAKFALFSSRHIGGQRSPLSSVLGKFA